MAKKIKPPNAVPDSMELWMAEIAMAFKGAEQFMRSPLVGTAAAGQKLDAWHVAPLMAVGARGLVDRENLLEHAADFAFHHFEANYGLDKADQVPPEIAFAFVYVGAHLGLSLIDAAQADRIMDVLEANPDTLASMIEKAAEMIKRNNPFAVMPNPGPGADAPARGKPPAPAKPQPPRKAAVRTPKEPPQKAAPAGAIYTLEISLLDIEPRIWRRVAVPATCSLGQLHQIIQVLFGWDNDHLHEFSVGGRRNAHELPERLSLAEAAPAKGSKLTYTYDFGDSWEHEIKVKAVGPAQQGFHYPVCEAGERAGPPEDCGGVWGYEAIIGMLKLPKNKRDPGRMEWLGKYDPEAFDLEQVNARLQRIGKKK